MPPERDRDLQHLKALVDALESPDAFARRDAIESLVRRTRKHLGFPWKGTADERSRAVARWRRWLREEEARRRTRAIREKLQALGPADLAGLGEAGIAAALSSTVEGMSPDAQLAFFQKLLEGIPGAGDGTSADSGASPGPPAPTPAAGAGAAFVPDGARNWPRCERCGVRPTSVSVTTRRRDDAWVRKELCWRCAPRP